ncbi:hypothetical protein HYFRA_00009402 [Hymenoscyphus fraxineus]|uniref:BRCT domain-containing protein n=1 Tax=Hymenoscyphus fraxineus TaxID=746836 RepID=A0A9N9PRR4_9HELO|nr:hypothetical protein HYFRA_00009402 [Hymenoscyphus fraxineus]
MGAIFDQCVIAFVPNRELPDSLIADYRKKIDDNGGTTPKARRDGSIKLEDVTHIISTTADFPQYREAREMMINVVRPTWLLESIMRNKPALTRPHTPDPNLIFHNVTVTCADLPEGDKDAIVGGVLAMGGTESSSLTKVVTHICALTMDHPKIALALEKGVNCKVVLPHWFHDCLRLGKRINELPYLLPDPEILKSEPDARLDIPSSEIIKGASTPRPDILPMATDSPRNLNVFQDKRLMISEDLNIGGRLRKVIEDLVVGGGGIITTSVHNADMYVCQWRGGRDYAIASYAGKDVGNLSWLYYLITHNEWTSPMKRLLHYPLPKDAIPGFKDLKITLSNYGGDSRTYLENLVLACGAEFTKSMKEDNTHVITARKSGEKCDAAAEWNIEMVNHLWIEESYARCEIQRITDPRYTCFPPRTNLGEIIGQTPFDMETLQQVYFPKEPTPSPGKPGPLKRPEMNQKGHKQKTPELPEDVDMDDDDDVHVPPVVIPAKKSVLPRGRSKSTTTLPKGTTTPIANRRVSAGKENDTPSSTNSRSAKDRALTNLHGMAPDIALYEKEKKRKGPVWGGERAANRIDKERQDERNSSPAVKEPREREDSEDENTNSKRQRTGLPQVSMRLLVTSYNPWVANPAREEKDKRKMRELGVLVVQDPIQCTYLAAPRMVRTKKFLCALATGPTILHTSFIEACGKSSVLPNTEAHLLKDTENEKKFDVKLKDAVVRAKANKRSLLRHVPIYCTNDVPNGSDTFKSIVQANGGIFSLYAGKISLKKVDPKDDPNGPEPVYLITGDKPNDRKLWPGFIAMAKRANMIPRIVTTSWILDVGMAQQLIWKDEYLIEP